MYGKLDVINFHLTERCNFKCTYCFAKFKDEYELNVSDCRRVIDFVNEYFIRNKITSGRINLAGGEPLIVNYLEELIDYIHSLGIKVSIITNGSLLSKKRIDKWIGKVDCIGISIDSLDFETNLLIGRVNRNGITINMEKLIEVLNYAKQNGIRLKVNSVVSKLNLNEDLSPLYRAIDFDRIKLLQVRINKNCNESANSYRITEDEFNSYCDKVAVNKGLIFEHDNEIECSYVIIDPQGNIITNKNNFHKKVGSIFEDTLEKLIIKAEINYDTFIKRYQIEKGVEN